MILPSFGGYLPTLILPVSFICILFYGQVACNPSVRSAFYLHTNARSWNEAKLICEAETAVLFRVTDAYTIDELLFVDSMPGWNGMFTNLLSTEKFWLAVYETTDPNNTYMNHGCVVPGIYNWASSEPKSTANREVCVAMDSKHSWLTEYCNQSYYFICQRPDGDCWFDPNEKTRGVSQIFAVDDVTVKEDADCATLCRNGWVNETECWGFSYRASDKTCRLHFQSDSTIYIKNTAGSVTADAEWMFYTKICLGGLLRNISVSYEDDHIDPQVLNCTELAGQESGWEEGICYCECQNPPPLWEPTISTLTLNEKIAQIVAELTIDSKNTSAAQRKLISAKDERPSAQSIGYVGVAFMSVVFGSILILDANLMFSHVHILVQQLKHPNSSQA